MKIEKINERTVLLLIIAIILIGGQILVFKGVRPFVANWQEQSRQIKLKNEIWKKSQDLVAQKATLEQTFEALNRKIQAKLPPAREESQFLTEIGNVAMATDVHVATMNPLPLRDLGSFQELSVEIDLEANLGNLVRFLYLLQESSVVLVANRLHIEPKAERSALLKGDLMISTIFLKEK